MQHLAPGFERFLKLTYILAEAHLSGARPDWRTLKDHSHNLLGLLDALLERVSNAEGYATRPVVAADLEFMGADPGVRKLVGALGYFGGGGRFARSDHLVDSGRGGADAEPSRRWEEIEQELVWARPDSEQIAESMDLMGPATFEVTARLQRLARAIARMWTFGALGEEGGLHYAALSVFARPDDDQLGLVVQR